MMIKILPTKRVVNSLITRTFFIHRVHFQQEKINDDQNDLLSKIRTLDYDCRSLLAEMQNASRSAKQEVKEINDSWREKYIKVNTIISKYF